MSRTTASFFTLFALSVIFFCAVTACSPNLRTPDEFASALMEAINVHDQSAFNALYLSEDDLVVALQESDAQFLREPGFLNKVRRYRADSYLKLLKHIGSIQEIKLFSYSLKDSGKLKGVYHVQLMIKANGLKRYIYIQRLLRIDGTWKSTGKIYFSNDELPVPSLKTIDQY